MLNKLKYLPLVFLFSFCNKVPQTGKIKQSDYCCASVDQKIKMVEDSINSIYDFLINHENDVKRYKEYYHSKIFIDKKLTYKSFFENCVKLVHLLSQTSDSCNYSHLYLKIVCEELEELRHISKCYQETYFNFDETQYNEVGKLSLLGERSVDSSLEGYERLKLLKKIKLDEYDELFSDLYSKTITKTIEYTEGLNYEISSILSHICGSLKKADEKNIAISVNESYKKWIDLNCDFVYYSVIPIVDYGFRRGIVEYKKDKTLKFLNFIKNINSENLKK